MLYLDNNASTQVDPEVFEEMKDYFVKYYGNPEAKYYEQAVIAQDAIAKARQRVAKLVGCNADEVIFNSGATEGNNTIIKGIAEYYRNKGNHIITTAVEHSSVYEVCKYLEIKGFEVTYLKVNKDCQIDINELISEIRSTTILVSIQWVNGEVGSVFPMKKIADICHHHSLFLHSDATQAIGKLKIDLAHYPGLSFITFSGHKIYGPKGIGVVINKKDNLGFYNKYTSLMHGGGQEFNQRGGTQNVPGIVGVGKSCELIKMNQKIYLNNIRDLEIRLKDLLKNKFGKNIMINNKFEHIAGIINLRFVNLNNQILLKNIASIVAASNGSACSNLKPSRVLQAMGFNKKEISESIRLSLSHHEKLESLELIQDL